MAQNRQTRVVSPIPSPIPPQFPFPGRQKAIAEELISGAFAEPSVKAELDAWQTQIADAIEDDRLVDGADWEASGAALLVDLPKLPENVRLMMSGLIAE